MIRPGDLRHRVVLEEAARTPDGGGGAIEAWQEITTLWAAISPVSGQERARHEAVEATFTHIITLRYRPGVQPDMRLRKDSRIFNIRAIRNLKEANRWLQCLCEEEIAS